MIVQHTSKECKTKFSIGVEFKNSLNGTGNSGKNPLAKALCLWYTVFKALYFYLPVVFHICMILKQTDFEISMLLFPYYTMAERFLKMNA